jgi:hypothetical protein
LTGFSDADISASLIAMLEQWKAKMRQAPRDASILIAVATFSVVGRAERISLSQPTKLFNRSFGSEIAQSDRSALFPLSP